MTIDTDASLIGWGTVCSGVCTGGLWSPEERKLHINHLELLLGSFAVQAFTKDKRNIHVHVRMDNSTACFMSARWEDPVKQFDRTSLSPMEVASTEGHNIVSRVPARCEQSGSRHGVLSGSDISRMETARDNISKGVPEAGTMSGRPICITPEQPTGLLSELET